LEWEWLKDVLYIIGAILGIVGLVWTATVYLLKTKFVTKEEIKGMLTKEEMMEYCTTNKAICHQQICRKIESLTKRIEGHIALDMKGKTRMDQRNIWLMKSMQIIVDGINQINKDDNNINLTDMPV